MDTVPVGVSVTYRSIHAEALDNSRHIEEGLSTVGPLTSTYSQVFYGRDIGEGRIGLPPGVSPSKVSYGTVTLN
jgi:hypothetical protein